MASSLRVPLQMAVLFILHFTRHLRNLHTHTRTEAPDTGELTAK